MVGQGTNPDSKLFNQMNGVNLEEQLNFATEILNNAGVVGLPTETVYGLAGRIDSSVAINKIFTIKERPFFDPLIVHVASLQQAKDCTVDWSQMAQCLAEKFWPGPLTLVLPKSSQISDLITSGLASVGLRWPQHATAQALINKVGVPLAAPSANKFGRTSPTSAQHVRDEFQDQVFVIDSESSQVGIESTVLLVKNIQAENRFQLSILRKGMITGSQIDEVLKNTPLDYSWIETIDKKESPGHMKHHYMPAIPLVICRNEKIKLVDLLQQLNDRLNEMPSEIEGVKIVKPDSKIEAIEFLRLSKQPELAARELYSQLRRASENGAEAICFMQTSQHQGDQWEAIFDRLNKAASLIIQ